MPAWPFMSISVYHCISCLSVCHCNWHTPPTSAADSLCLPVWAQHEWFSRDLPGLQRQGSTAEDSSFVDGAATMFPSPPACWQPLLCLWKQIYFPFLYTIYTSYHSVPLEDLVWYNTIQYKQNACVHIIAKSLVERFQVTCLISLCHSCSPGTWG